MKRRNNISDMAEAAPSSSKGMKGDGIKSSSPHDLIQLRPGVRLVDGCQVVVGEGKSARQKLPDCRMKEAVSLSRLADLSINEPLSVDKRRVTDFNDRFPDEILLHIFKYTWRPVHCWDAAKVCKRWCILQACNQLQKASNHSAGRYPCLALKKGDRSGRKSNCDGKSKILKLKRVESEWRFAMDLLKTCKRHTHTLEIKDCTHVSVRGYQLLSGFASNLRALRLESCNSMDNPSFYSILDRCSTLRSIHLSMVPKLSLRNIEKKAPKLQQLHVYGCRNVTVGTVISILEGCLALKSLCLSAMGGFQDWDVNKIEAGPPLKLQHLELVNTVGVTDKFLQAFSPRLTNLRRLDLTQCPMVTDDGFSALIDACGKSLLKLVMTRCRGISDEAMGSIARAAIKLQDLSLAGCKVTNRGIEVLLQGRFITELRTFSLACTMVTDDGLKHFASKEKRLTSFKSLDVQNCPGISIFGLRGLPKTLNGKAYKLCSEKKNVMITE